MAASQTTSSPLSAPWRGRFFGIWIPQQLSLVGSALGQFALVWWVTQTTGSATVLATAMLVAMLPSVLGGPVVGALVDRWNRQRVMIAADAMVALASAVLALLFWTGALRIWHVYVIMCLRGIGGTFHSPAMNASTSLMVPEEQLPRVGGLNQMMQGAVNIVAPPLGALLLGLLPLHGIMALDVITAAVAIAPLWFVTIPQPERAISTAGSPFEVLMADIREGWRYVTSWKGLLYLAILTMAINFVGAPAMTLLPILVTQHFGGGATQLAWLSSAWGVGLLAGGLTLSAWGGFRRRIVTVIVGLFGMGVGILVVGLAPAHLLVIGVVGLFGASAMSALCNGSIFAIMQARVAPEMQGRVFAVLGSLCAAMMPIGMAIAGPVADTWGPAVLYLAAAVGLLVAAVVALLVPAIMQIERGEAASAAQSG